MTARSVRRPGAAVASLSLLALVSAGLSACESGSALPGSQQDSGDPSTGATAEPAAQPRLRLNVRRGAREVPVDTVLAVRNQKL